MINLESIGFKQIMTVYSLTNEMNPPEIEVAVPDVFVDKGYASVESVRMQKGDTSIYKNAIIPALSKYYVSKNYIRLPVIADFAGVSNVIGPSFHAIGTTLKISSSEPTNYPINVGIGQVKVGDKLIAVFINGDPDKGFIIGRCRDNG